ncbi:hypothetical protein TNCV_3428321 [Trichonephila clavipes]|nr:hypothetical protein TNCV_3428321 [Trichonephila clavipes]
MLGRRIAARPRPPATVRDLEIALLEEWNSIPQSLIDNLIASMANRLVEEAKRERNRSDVTRARVKSVGRGRKAQNAFEKHQNAVGRKNAAIFIFRSQNEKERSLQVELANATADSDDGNEMNNTAPVPTSSEMRNILRNMRSCLDVHSV